MSVSSALPWTLYTELVVGRGHPTFTDTDNRALRQVLTSSGLGPDNGFQGLMPVFNVMAYGALGNNTADDSQAIRDAVADATTFAGAGGVRGGVVYFPPGIYKINSSLTFNAITDVQLVGAGNNSSMLAMGASGVMLLNFTGVCSRITVRELWLGSFSSLAAGGAISIVGTVGTHSDTFRLENLTLQNVPVPAFFQYLDNSNARNVRAVQTIAGAVKGVVCGMNTCISDSFREFLAFATTGSFPNDVVQIDYDCDTVWFVDSQALNGTGYGFNLLQSAGSTGPRLVRLTNCYAESNSLDGFIIQATRDARLSGCHAAVNNRYGINVTGGTAVAIVNTLAFQNQQHGIYLNGGAGHLVDGCVASNNSQQTNATYDGIVIATNDVRIVNNRSGDFILTLANKQRAGLNLTAGTDFLSIGGNRLEGNTGLGFEQPIVNSSTGANNQILGNGFATPSEGAVVAGLDCKHLGGTIDLVVTLTAARLIGALSTPFKGQRVTFTFVQSGAGAFAVTWNAVYKTSWADAGNATPKRSSISYVYDGANWNQDGAQTPYV